MWDWPRSPPDQLRQLVDYPRGFLLALLTDFSIDLEMIYWGGLPSFSSFSSSATDGTLVDILNGEGGYVSSSLYWGRRYSNSVLRIEIGEAI